MCPQLSGSSTSPVIIHLIMFYRKYLNRQTNSSKEAASQIDDTRVTSETNAADQAQLRHRNENTFQETQR